MKKEFLILLALIFIIRVNANTYKTVESKAGSLSSLLTDEEKKSVSHLTVRGVLDARDFELFRSGRMFQLREIDLTEVVIESYGNSPRKALPNGAFLRCGTLLSVTLPKNLTAIGDSSMYKCQGLKSIVIPDSVKYIGKYAFSLNQNLTNVHLSSSLTNIDDLAFYLCQNLQSITITNSVKRIGNLAFGGCGLKNIELPNSVNVLGDGAFASCTALCSVTLPESISQFGAGVFGSSGLKYITIPNSIDSIPEGTFSGCHDLDSVTIPKNIRYVGNSAFRDCSSLTTISLPDSVKYIGDYAFCGCVGMSAFNVRSVMPIDLSNRVHLFDFIDKRLCALYVPFGSAGAYRDAVGWHEFLRISESGMHLDDVQMDTIELKRSLRITAGSLSSSLTWYEMANITELTLEGEIDYRDLTTLRYNFPKLSILTMTNSVVKAYDNNYEEGAIPYDAFRNSSTLTSISLPSNTLAIGDNAFCNCTSLKQVIFPESLFYIGKASFLGCTELEFVECPPSCGYIDVAAFAACKKLFWITLPNTIEFIGGGAFCGCTRLEMVVLPESLASLSTGIFSRCLNLKKVVLPESLTQIGVKAFESCRQLSEMSIPENVTTLDSGAFAGCFNLNTIKMNASFPINLSRSTDVFKGVSNTCTLQVPLGAAESYKNAIGWSYFRIVTEMEMGSPVITKNESDVVWYDSQSKMLHFKSSDAFETITLFNACGKVVFVARGGNVQSVSLNTIQKGLYFIQIKSKTRIRNQKILM